MPTFILPASRDIAGLEGFAVDKNAVHKEGDSWKYGGGGGGGYLSMKVIYHDCNLLEIPPAGRFAEPNGQKSFSNGGITISSQS